MVLWVYLSFIYSASLAIAATVNACPPGGAAPEVTIQRGIEGLVESILNPSGGGKDLFPKAWIEKRQTTELKVNESTGLKLEEGRGYGAVAYQSIGYPFSQVRRLFSKADAPVELLRAVKTLRHTETLSEPPSQTGDPICLKTDIDVPVVADYHTQVQLRVLQTNSRVTLEWKQINREGKLDYNQGAMIIEPDGNNSKVTVIGVHIVKNAERVPWVGRGTAIAFAKTHYGNFIEALTTVLAKLDPSPK